MKERKRDRVPLRKKGSLFPPLPDRRQPNRAFRKITESSFVWRSGESRAQSAFFGFCQWQRKCVWQPCLALDVWHIVHCLFVYVDYYNPGIATNYKESPDPCL